MTTPKRIGIALGSALVATAVIVPVAKSDFDLPGLNQQVQNHEARISNNEKDIKNLQTNTNTPPSNDHVSVPPVTATQTTTPAPNTSQAAPTQAVSDPTPAPQPSQPTKPSVTSSSLRSVYYFMYSDTQEADKYYCDYSWSDGRTGTVYLGDGRKGQVESHYSEECRGYIGQTDTPAAQPESL